MSSKEFVGIQQLNHPRLRFEMSKIEVRSTQLLRLFLWQYYGFLYAPVPAGLGFISSPEDELG